MNSSVDESTIEDRADTLELLDVRAGVDVGLRIISSKPILDSV